MVRTHNRPRRSPQNEQLQDLLDDESDSSDYTRGSQSNSTVHRSRNTTRQNDPSPQRRSRRQQDSSVRQQDSSSRNNRNNQQQQPSKATTSKAKPTGAAKRKPAPKKIPVLHHIRYLQMTTENLIPKAPFCRVLKEILHHLGDFRITKEAIDALQTMAEDYMTGVFCDAYRLTIHRSRVTIEPRDIDLLLYIRGYNQT